MERGRCTSANRLEDTHRPPPLGQAKSRAIHEATENQQVPLGNFVSSKLGRVLPLERHILRSVEEFHERVQKLVLGPNDSFITADVKDFFGEG